MNYIPDHVIRIERQAFRDQALTIPCPYCKQPVGYECVIPKTDNRPVKQPAHMWRLKDSGCM